MKKIETDADVLDWARMMVEAKGDKFTPLSKGDQFVIAKYIMNIAFDGETTERDSVGQPAFDPESATATATKAEEPPPPPPMPSVQGDSVSAPLEPPTSKAPMTRADAYHRVGFDVQQAYDKFLDWCKDHPKSKEVMDFSTGHKSVDAAFAYWLGETITVDIPSQDNQCLSRCPHEERNACEEDGYEYRPVRPKGWVGRL